MKLISRDLHLSLWRYVLSFDAPSTTFARCTNGGGDGGWRSASAFSRARESQGSGLQTPRPLGQHLPDIIDPIEHLNFAVYRLDEYGVQTGEKETGPRLDQRNASIISTCSLPARSRLRSATDQAYKLRAVLGGSLPDQDQDMEDMDARALSAQQQELECLNLLRGPAGRPRSRC